MFKNTKQQIDSHIKTHSVRSVEDNAAVTTIKNIFKNDGKIKDTFSSDDKWPNHDGTIELVPDLNSRRPYQCFYVQIKGTSIVDNCNNGKLKYRLQDLAFPAFAYSVTLDPCILFVVFNPIKRGRERVFWKYMSSELLNSVDFNNSSCLIEFDNEDEIFNSDESVDAFVNNLIKISEIHSFASRLSKIEYKKSDVLDIITDCSKKIEESIDRLDFYNETRDNISRRMLNYLEGLCTATLLLNAFSNGYESPSEKEAWENALLNINTKCLAIFLQRLRYLAHRIPADGQSERLMVQYYDFLWEIKKTLLKLEDITIISNLGKFPLDLDKDDEKYHTIIATAIKKAKFSANTFSSSRYYVQKKEIFFVDGEKYYEITLQLAGIYATKYNRLTVYTQQNISTNYSIQIRYNEIEVNLWDEWEGFDKVPTNIKVVSGWKVSIDPTVLNKFATIFNLELRISSNYGEYSALMEFLTRSGISLLDLIDFSSKKFEIIIDEIYSKSKTNYYKEILKLLHNNFSSSSKNKGRNVVRYVLLQLREDIIDDVKLGKYDRALPSKIVYLSSGCCPFDSNPILYNLPKHKTISKTVPNDIVRTIGLKDIADSAIYLKIKYLSETTGEIYIRRDILDIENISERLINYNNGLSEFDRLNRCTIKQNGEYVYIEEYEYSTLSILKELLNYTETGNLGQQSLNNSFLKTLEFQDELKRNAIKNVFVDSKVIIIYGAAGTGKTTLINYISDLMKGRSKLFLAKTHTAEENLKRRITSPGESSDFMGIDQYLKPKSNKIYDVIFIDECSIVDNRTMMNILNKINNKSLLVLVGDIYQIESIEFGNWFVYAKDILKRSAIVELTNNWRTQDVTIRNLWDSVRNREVCVSEQLVIDGPFSEKIGTGIFSKWDEDEIVLCLNYDGRYGLNNLNRYFQDVNPEKYFDWGDWKYKIGDRILFNDNRRFPKLYNNLKGRIIDIKKFDCSISFTIDVETSLTGIDAIESNFEYVDSWDNITRIRITIYEYQGGATDEEREEAKMKSIIPFQIAYAVSIHKAQGLEFNSVKIVIPSNNSELISHGIFYTAITRTKEKLKIFWSAETMKKITLGFQDNVEENHSLAIIKSKLKQ